MENYAENLLPNNQVERVQALANLSNRTFLVTYTNEIDRELLMDRFSKRSAKMKLFESFRTNTFIIKSSNQNAPITSAQMTTLKEEIESKLTKKNIYFFFKSIFYFYKNHNNRVYFTISVNAVTINKTNRLLVLVILREFTSHVEIYILNKFLY
jgi:hypothetical protein